MKIRASFLPVGLLLGGLLLAMPACQSPRYKPGYHNGVGTGVGTGTAALIAGMVERDRRYCNYEVDADEFTDQMVERQLERKRRYEEYPDYQWYRDRGYFDDDGVWHMRHLPDRRYSRYHGYLVDWPYGLVTRHPGFVKSPYPPYRLINVRGIRREAKVLDPASGRLFINP